MKQIFYFLLIIDIGWVIANDNPSSMPSQNGFFIEKSNEVRVILAKEFWMSDTFINPQGFYFLRNYLNGQKDGLEICYSMTGIFYIARYKENVLTGGFEFYPDGIFNIKINVENGLIDGKCLMTFQPFKYKAANIIETDGYSEKYDDIAIKDGSPSLIVQTSGEFKKGKRYQGEFLNVMHHGLYREVSIEKYSEGKLVNRAC